MPNHQIARVEEWAAVTMALCWIIMAVLIWTGIPHAWLIWLAIGATGSGFIASVVFLATFLRRQFGFNAAHRAMLRQP